MAELKKTSPFDLEVHQEQVSSTDLNELEALGAPGNGQDCQGGVEGESHVRRVEEDGNVSCSELSDPFDDEDEVAEHNDSSKKRKQDSYDEKEAGSWSEDEKEMEDLDEIFEEREEWEKKNDPVREKEMTEMLPSLPSGPVNLITLTKKRPKFSVLSEGDKKRGFRSGRGVLISVDDIEPLIRKDGPKLFIPLGAGVYRSTMT